MSRLRESRILAIAALSLLWIGTCAIPAGVRAQNVSAGVGTRKVRSKVVPAYPDIARQAHVTGTVRLQATVSADGSVEQTKVIGGSPVLVGAATEALNKWKFEPTSSETTETVEFAFSGLN